MTFAVFAKHLQAWPLDVCCARVREAGFDGLDVTVRPGGYVEPGADFNRRFAEAVRVVRGAGLSIPLLTTGITSTDDPDAERIMRCAAEHGIRELKLHYWSWNRETPFPRMLDAAVRSLDGLERLARAAGVRINLHCHSGDFVTHRAEVIDRLIRDRDPAYVGAYLDPAHLTIEGGLAGWRSGIELLLPRLTLLAVKDFRWVESPQGTGHPQERRWVPVGTGNVPWREVLRMVRSNGFSGPVSIHGEYQGRWSWKELDAAEVLEQCRADREWIRGI